MDGTSAVCRFFSEIFPKHSICDTVLFRADNKAVAALVNMNLMLVETTDRKSVV